MPLEPERPAVPLGAAALAAPVLRQPQPPRQPLPGSDLALAEVHRSLLQPPMPPRQPPRRTGVASLPADAEGPPADLLPLREARRQSAVELGVHQGRWPDVEVSPSEQRRVLEPGLRAWAVLLLAEEGDKLQVLSWLDDGQGAVCLEEHGNGARRRQQKWVRQQQLREEPSVRRTDLEA